MAELKVRPTLYPRLYVTIANNFVILQNEDKTVDVFGVYLGPYGLQPLTTSSVITNGNWLRVLTTKEVSIAENLGLYVQPCRALGGMFVLPLLSIL